MPNTMASVSALNPWLCNQVSCPKDMATAASAAVSNSPGQIRRGRCLGSFNKGAGTWEVLLERLAVVMQGSVRRRYQPVQQLV